MDLEQYLRPIPGPKPVGEYLRWEKEYADIEAARLSEEDTTDDAVWSRKVKRASWEDVIEIAHRVLVEKSKDLQIVAWMTEALAHKRGLNGIADGLNLFRAVQGAFWPKAHPDDGDPDLLRAVYEFLDSPKVLPLEIRNQHLTFIRESPPDCYSFRKYEESRTTENKLKKAKNDDERQLLDGYLRAEQFDQAAAQTPRAFYVDLLDACRACREAVDQLNDDVRQRWPATPRERPPQLSQVLAALDDVTGVAKQILAKKPAPVEEAPAEPEEDSVADDEVQVDDSSEPQPEETAQAQPARTARARARSAPMGEPASPEEAIARIIDAAHFLRRSDPSDPISYLVIRAARGGGLYRGDDALEPDRLAPPASDVRQRLYQLFKAGDGGDWSELLEASERALGGPEGGGWVDPHVYSARALDSLGHEHASKACKSLLAAFLRDHTAWLDSQLGDGTPCASKPARDWIAAEPLFNPPPPEDDDAPAPFPVRESRPVRQDIPAESSESVDTGPPDAWDEAMRLRQAGRHNEAIAVMVQAVRQARTGRERFLRTLQQAELCMSMNRAALAQPMLEFLAKRLDELHLDQWEDPSLCARVLTQYYHCLRGTDEARAAMIFNRLCQLDAGAAILLSSPK